MTTVYQFVAGDTGSTLVVTCKNESDGAIIDLTGCSVQLKWRDAARVLVSKAMTINAPATNGVVQYTFGASELFAPSMKFEVQITDGSGRVIRNLELLDVKVRQPLA